MSLKHAHANPVPRSFEPLDKPMLTDPTALLKDLVELLEEYGPTWYTEELHIRARIALSNVHTSSNVHIRTATV